MTRVGSQRHIKKKIEHVGRLSLRQILEEEILPFCTYVHSHVDQVLIPAQFAWHSNWQIDSG